MSNSPLDAPTGFHPAEEDRPAGPWMEGYWAQTAPWAKRFAFAVWAYVGWQIYTSIRYFAHVSDMNPTMIGMYAGVLLIYCPIVALGYFCFRFGQDLERALAQQDQLPLEKAFSHLHRFLLLSLLIAIFWTIIVCFRFRNAFNQSLIIN